MRLTPSFRSPGLWAWILALAVLGFLAGLTGMRDEDAFHLLAWGRELVRNEAPPATEPFLFPFAGTPSGLGPSWLSALAIYATRTLVGPSGPVFLAAFLLAALVALMAIDALPERVGWAEALAVLLPIALAIATIRPRAVPRPEMLANLLLAATLLLVRRDETRGGRTLWLVPFLMLLWTHVHGSAIAGAAVVGLHAFAGTLQRLIPGGSRLPGTPSRAHLARAWFVTLLALVAAATGPSAPLRTAVSFLFAQQGVQPGFSPEVETALRQMKWAVGELRPLGAQDLLGPFGALASLTIASFVLSIRSVRPRELLTALAFLGLAVSAWRFTATAAVVLAPIAGRNLSISLRGVLARRRVRAAVAALSVAGALMAARATMSDPALPFGVRLAHEKFPVRGAEYLREVGFEGRLFNTFHFGGYLEWTLDRPVFQDGRGMLRPEDVTAALNGPAHEPAFAELDRRYRFDALVVAYPVVTPQMREAFSGGPEGTSWFVPRDRWGLAAFDDGGLLFLRRDGRYGALLERDEFRLVVAENDFPLGRLADPAFARGFLDELARASRSATTCGGCRTWQAIALLHLGREAEALAAAGDRIEEARTELHRLEAVSAEERRRREVPRLHAEGRRRIQEGAPDAAASTLRSAIDLGGGDDVRRDHVYALLVAGRVTEARQAIRELVEHSPGYPDARFLQGLVLEAAGDHHGAVAAYGEYLRLAPEGADAAAAAERLGALGERPRPTAR